jgi:imidazolonepropionase-like amidohydrolase
MLCQDSRGVNLRCTRPVLAITLFAAVCRLQTVASNAGAPTTVIGDVTVISPERPVPLIHAYVRIADGRIAEVSRRPLKGDLNVDGRGKFLIPGLIDSHTHLGTVPGMLSPQRSAHPDLAVQAGAQEPHSYLYFGFTTVLSLGDTAEAIRRWNALDVRPEAYFCGGTPIANGYAFTSFTANPYFLFNPDQANALPASVDQAGHAPAAVVERMARDGAICVKSYREGGFGPDTGRLPMPSVETIRAVVAAAHARNMPVFLHANSMAAQEFAVEAGVDVIAHGMWNGHGSTAEKLDTGVEPILQAVLQHGMGYQPTAQVIRGLGAEVDDAFLADPLLSHVYAPNLIAWYRSPEGGWFRRLDDTTPAVY